MPYFIIIFSIKIPFAVTLFQTFPNDTQPNDVLLVFPKFHLFQNMSSIFSVMHLKIEINDT